MSQRLALGVFGMCSVVMIGIRCVIVMGKSIDRCIQKR